MALESLDTLEMLSCDEAQATLPEAMDNVCANHIPLMITNFRGNSVVMMSLEDFNSLQETAYLLSSPANAQWLEESLAQVDAGETVLVDIDSL